MTPTPEFDKLKLLYEENATQFRFFLTWRQLLVAGYFAVLAALALGFEWAVTNAPDLTFACPLAGAFASVFFWFLDHRNRELYNHASDTGARIEEAMGYPNLGYYGTYRKEVKESTWRHSNVLTVFYLACGGAMLVIAVGSLFLRLLVTVSGR